MECAGTAPSPAGGCQGRRTRRRAGETPGEEGEEPRPLADGLPCKLKERSPPAPLCLHQACKSHLRIATLGTFDKRLTQDFAAGPAVQNRRFHCRGRVFDPGRGTKIPHAVRCGKKNNKPHSLSSVSLVDRRRRMPGQVSNSTTNSAGWRSARSPAAYQPLTLALPSSQDRDSLSSSSSLANWKRPKGRKRLLENAAAQPARHTACVLINP